MKVCFYGCFNEDYDRNWSIINAVMFFANVKILNSKKNFFLRSAELFPKALFSNFDVLVVLYPGHLDVLVAKIVCLLKRKPLLFDKFVSQMDSEIEYGNIEKNSLKAKMHWFLDWLGCKISDKVFLDTEEHVRFFERELGIKANYSVIPIGVNQEFFYPLKTNSKKFQVLYYGITTPFHGFDIICKAAALLSKESINFVFVGASKHYKAQKNEFAKFRNIKFLDPVSMERLGNIIATSSVCLGVFGKTPKVERVVPLKVIEPMACRRAVISGIGKTLENAFINQKEILFCEKNPEALANAILELKNNSKLRNSIACNAFSKFERKHSAKALSTVLQKEVREVLKR